MAEVNCDGNFVMKNLLNLNDENGKEVLFLKQMTKHLVEIDHDVLPRFKNILLIRNPRDIFPEKL